MTQDLPSSLAGKLLLAMPDMPDPRFRRSVILMCVHDVGGALGIALDEPMDGIGLHAMLSSFEIDTKAVPEAVVLAGGPVEPRRGFVLHSRDWLAADSFQVTADLALTGSIEILRAIADGSGPTDYFVALGYAGWSEGQLEAELGRPGWFVGQAEPRELFDVAPEDRWAKAFELQGIDPAMLASSSGRA